MCDWNNDDRLDLVAGERNGWFTLFLRTAAGTLTSAGQITADGSPIHANNNSWPFVCDWNNDGRKDLLVGQEGIGAPCNVYLYLNQGADSLPVFGDSVPVLCAGSALRNYRCVPVAIDLDRDGAKDLVLGEWYSSVRFYRNTGPDSAPLFTTFINLVEPDPDSFLNGNPPRVNFTDWDGDTDLDMVTCDYYGSVFLRRNVTPTAVAAPAPPGSTAIPASVVRGSFVLPPSPLAGRSLLFDVNGRTVLTLRPGRNDVRKLAPGVYFAGPAGDKVIVAP